MGVFVWPAANDFYAPSVLIAVADTEAEARARVVADVVRAVEDSHAAHVAGVEEWNTTTRVTSWPDARYRPPVRAPYSLEERKKWAVEEVTRYLDAGPPAVYTPPFSFFQPSVG